MPIDLERVIFVIGVGRSGTTLLQCMLNAHSHISFLPETHFIRRYGDNPHMARLVRRRGMAALASRLSQDPDMARTGIDPADCPQCRDMREWFRWLLGRYAAARGAVRVGEKDPKNMEHLRLIRQWFPRARVIHLVRDPRDVMVSRLGAGWGRKRFFLAHLAACREQLLLACRLGPELFGSSYVEIRYEDLVTRAPETLMTLCSRLDLEYEPEMLNYMSPARELISEKELPWKKNCFRPLLTGNIGKWRRELSPRRVRRIEWVCAKTFTRFGYPHAFPGPLPSHQRAAAVFWKGIFKLVDLAYHLRYGRRPPTKQHG